MAAQHHKSIYPTFPSAWSHKGKSQTCLPLKRTILPYSSSNPPKRNGCKRSLCCFLIIFLILLVATAAIFYKVFDPKIPIYSVQSVTMTKLDVNPDNSLEAVFDADVRVTNPNEKIGIYFEHGSLVSLFFRENKLCDGSLPVFYQGHRNTTVIRLKLTGKSPDAFGLVQSLEAQQETGTIPLDLRAIVPVRIELGSLRLMKLKFSLRCGITVENLENDSTIRVSGITCKGGLRF